MLDDDERNLLEAVVDGPDDGTAVVTPPGPTTLALCARRLITVREGFARATHAGVHALAFLRSRDNVDAAIDRLCEAAWNYGDTSACEQFGRVETDASGRPPVTESERRERLMQAVHALVRADRAAAEAARAVAQDDRERVA